MSSQNHEDFQESGSDSDIDFEALDSVPPSTFEIIQDLYEKCLDASFTLKHDNQTCRLAIDELSGDLRVTSDRIYKKTRVCTLIRNWLLSLQIRKGKVYFNTDHLEELKKYKGDEKTVESLFYRG